MKMYQLCFKLKHGKDYKSYFDGGQHDKMRKELFLAQRAKINQHNGGESPSYKKELNKFSDMVYMGAVSFEL